jgi:peptide chain release factor subunit 1
LLSEYKNYGCKLEIVTDKTPQGHQFCKGFGGIGAFLRYEKNDNTYTDQYDEVSDDEF